jgi:hypothetical protein
VVIERGDLLLGLRAGDCPRKVLFGGEREGREDQLGSAVMAQLIGINQVALEVT